MTHGRETQEPIGDQVPVADAIDQRRTVDDSRELSEDFQPTEASEIAETGAPDEANPADWQEQLTSAEIADDWDVDTP